MIYVNISEEITLYFNFYPEKFGGYQILHYLCKHFQEKLYNVKKGVWHTHTLDKDGTVLIVENQDTNDDNSPTKSMSLEQLEQLDKVYER